MRSDSRLCEWSYPKARLTAGLRVSWTPRAGLEPAPVRWTVACSTKLSYLGVVALMYRLSNQTRKALFRTCSQRAEASPTPDHKAVDRRPDVALAIRIWDQAPSTPRPVVRGGERSLRPGSGRARRRRAEEDSDDHRVGAPTTGARQLVLASDHPDAVAAGEVTRPGELEANRPLAPLGRALDHRPDHHSVLRQMGERRVRRVGRCRVAVADALGDPGRRLHRPDDVPAVPDVHRPRVAARTRLPPRQRAKRERVQPWRERQGCEEDARAHDPSTREPTLGVLLSETGQDALTGAWHHI